MNDNPTPEGARERLRDWLDSTLGDVQIYPADVRALLDATEPRPAPPSPQHYQHQYEWLLRELHAAHGGRPGKYFDFWGGSCTCIPDVRTHLTLRQAQDRFDARRGNQGSVL
ncbi:hypothetical protein [Microbacterium sp.]|uniref:hypothetical protein n=1 Tax=Microbacterium sp. TaxID=51671 RepID=UPI003F72A85A